MDLDKSFSGMAQIGFGPVALLHGRRPNYRLVAHHCSEIDQIRLSCLDPSHFVGNSQRFEIAGHSRCIIHPFP